MNQFNNSDGTEEIQQISPHHVSKRAIIVAIVFFALIVIGMFTFAFLKKSELEKEMIVDDSFQPVSEVLYPSITRVDAKHYFIDGVHTLVGEVDMPTPCDLLEADSIVRESYPEQVEITFSVLNNSEVCSQVITPQRFKVTASASQEAVFTANLMGRFIELNLIPASEGELPEDFELFIKG